MLLPALAKARDKARDVSCKNNLKQIGLAATFYQNHYNDYLAPPLGTGDAPVPNSFIPWYHWPYEFGKNMLGLPMINYWNCRASGWKTFRCPTDTRKPWGSYTSENCALLSYGMPLMLFGYFGAKNPPPTIGQVRNPANTIYVAENQSMARRAGNSAAYAEAECAACNYNTGYVALRGSSNMGWNHGINRNNMLLADGHVIGALVIGDANNNYAGKAGNPFEPQSSQYDGYAFTSVSWQNVLDYNNFH